MRKAIICASVVSMAAGMARADALDHWYGEEYKSCADGSTMEIVVCVGGLHADWDARLNAAYSKLMGFQNDKRRTALRDAQRAWIAYRDANCGWYDGGEGTISRIEAATCMYVLTRDRAQELEMATQL